MANNKEKPKEEEKPKQPTTLENIVSESTSAAKSLIGAGALATAGLFYGAGGLAVAASRPVGALMVQEKVKFMNESLYGLVQVPVFSALFNTSLNAASSLDSIVNVMGYSMHTAPLIAGGIVLAAAPIITTLLYPVGYFIFRGSFKGLREDAKKRYGKHIKDTAKYFCLPMAIATAAATVYTGLVPYLLPLAAAANLFYRLGTAEKYYFKNLMKPITYPISGTISLLGRTYRGVTSAMYDIGSAIGSLFRKSPEPKPA